MRASTTPPPIADDGYPSDSVGAELRTKNLKVYAPMDDGLLPALSAC